MLAAARTLADSLFGRHRRAGGTPRRFAVVQPFAFSWKKTTLMKFIARGLCCRAAEAAWPPSDRSPSLSCLPPLQKTGSRRAPRRSPSSLQLVLLRRAPPCALALGLSARPGALGLPLRRVPASTAGMFRLWGRCRELCLV